LSATPNVTPIRSHKLLKRDYGAAVVDMGGQGILINYSADSTAAKRQREQKGLLLGASAIFPQPNTGCFCIYLFWHFTPHTKGKFGPREREEQICWRPELKEWVIRRKKIKSSLRFLPGEITHFVWPSAATALIHLMSAAPQEVILLLEHTHAGRDPRHKASPFDMPPSPTTADLIFS